MNGVDKTVRVQVQRESAGPVVRASTRNVCTALGLEHATEAALSAALLEIIHRGWQSGAGGELVFEADKSQLSVSLICASEGFEPEALKRSVLQVESLVDSVQALPPTVMLGVKLSGRQNRLWPSVYPSTPTDDGAELAAVNSDLVTALGWIQQLARNEARLRSELDECRRGVGHLYAELDRNAEQLRRLADGRSRFISSMTHEFRTPLGSILTLSRLLLDEVDGKLEAEQGRQVGFVKKSAETLSELVNDLIELSRLDAGRAPVNVRSFRVTELFATMMGQLRPLLRSEAVSLVFEEPAGDCVLATDETKLAQILRNLLSNALKYTERGQIRVRAMMNADESIVFSVSDTGVGIAAADQERIFEEFVQIEGAHQRRVKGSGLGLPISRRLAQLLGGRLWVESVPGQGSTFHLQVPMRLHADSSRELTERPTTLEPSLLIVARSREAVARHERTARKVGLAPLPAQDTPLARQLLASHAPSAMLVEVDVADAALWRIVDEVSAAAELPVFVVGLPSAKDRALTARATFLDREGRDDAIAGALAALKTVSDRPLVLLVDDDDAHRYLMRRLLLLLNVHVVEAATGRAALTAVSERKPAAILLDLSLPDVDGREVLQQLRAAPETSRIPVIVQSGISLSPQEFKELTSAEVVLTKDNVSQDAQLRAMEDAFRRVGIPVRSPSERTA